MQKKEKIYLGQKTESWIQPVIYRKWWEFWKLRCWTGKTKHSVYYETAFDFNGNGLLCGDKVKVIVCSNNLTESVGKIDVVVEIFDGDLRLKESGYCWPSNVVKLI